MTSSLKLRIKMALYNGTAILKMAQIAGHLTRCSRSLGRMRGMAREVDLHGLTAPVP